MAPFLASNIKASPSKFVNLKPLFAFNLYKTVNLLNEQQKSNVIESLM